MAVWRAVGAGPGRWTPLSDIHCSLSGKVAKPDEPVKYNQCSNINCMELYLNKTHRGSSRGHALSTVLTTDAEWKRRHRIKGDKRKARKGRAGKRRARTKTDRIAIQFL